MANRNRNSKRQFVEIDYEKLANAIVNAQESSNNDVKGHKSRNSLINFLNGTIYIILAVFCVWGIVRYWSGSYVGTVESLIQCILITAILAVFAVWFFLCQQESLSDKGKGAIDDFSLNISLAALLVSLVALLGGGK